MRRGLHGARPSVAALTVLLTGSIAGASGLVLCLGVDGHRALELEHAARACPTLATPPGTTGISVESPGECLDLPAAGAGPMMPSSFDGDRLPMPPLAALCVHPESTPQVATRFPAPTHARAGPHDLAPHHRSTVLLV